MNMRRALGGLRESPLHQAESIPKQIAGLLPFYHSDSALMATFLKRS